VSLYKKFFNFFRKCFLPIFFLGSLSPVYFLNRYFVPELTDCILRYKNVNNGISFIPFVMSTKEANPSCGVQNLNIYEIDGGISLARLAQSCQLYTNNNTIMLPSEWIAYNYNVPIRLNGGIQNSGLGWNAQYMVTPRFSVGWSSALCLVLSAMNISPQEETDKYKLKEGMLFEIMDFYKSMTHAMGLDQACSRYVTFADQDIYFKFDFDNDFFWQFRKLKFTIQGGVVVPTAKKVDLYNPSDVPVGCGFSSVYCGAFLDLLLKEDINFGVTGKLMYQFPKEQKMRLARWQESQRYGSFVGDVLVTPGYIYQASPYLSIEGLRRGLGAKVGYTIWGKSSDQFGFGSHSLEIIDQAKMFAETFSAWVQEHCECTIFYDFMREETTYKFEPFLGLSFQIPVNFIAAKNSGKSYSVSLIAQVLF
jgi:hypothetical protein